MNCDFCLKPITSGNPGIVDICPRGHDHKFHETCLGEAAKSGCYVTVVTRAIEQKLKKIEDKFIWAQVPYIGDPDGEWTMRCLFDEDWQALKQAETTNEN